MENQPKKRGRPFLPRDEYGNIIRPNKADNTPIKAVEDQPKARAMVEPNHAGIDQNDHRETVTKVKYLSVAEALSEAISGKPLLSENMSVLRSTRDRSDKNWYGWDSKIDALGLARVVNNGWIKGAGKLFDLSDNVTVPKIESITRKLAFRDEGEEICLDRLNSGDFEHMWRGFAKKTKKQGKSRIVKIVANIASNAYIGAEEQFWAGACAVVLADALVKAGYSVEIEAAIIGTHMHGQEFDIRTTVKNPDEHLSLTNLASTICLSGYFRAIGHCLSTIHSNKELHGCGFTPVKELGAEDAILVNFNTAKDIHSAKAWIDEQLEAFN